MSASPREIAGLKTPPEDQITVRMRAYGASSADEPTADAGKDLDVDGEGKLRNFRVSGLSQQTN